MAKFEDYGLTSHHAKIGLPSMQHARRKMRSKRRIKAIAELGREVSNYDIARFCLAGWRRWEAAGINRETSRLA